MRQPPECEAHRGHASRAFAQRAMHAAAPLTLLRLPFISRAWAQATPVSLRGGVGLRMGTRAVQPVGHGGQPRDSATFSPRSAPMDENADAGFPSLRSVLLQLHFVRCPQYLHRAVGRVCQQRHETPWMLSRLRKRSDPGSSETPAAPNTFRPKPTMPSVGLHPAARPSSDQLLTSSARACSASSSSAPIPSCALPLAARPPNHAVPSPIASNLGCLEQHTPAAGGETSRPVRLRLLIFGACASQDSRQTQARPPIL